MAERQRLQDENRRQPRFFVQAERGRFKWRRVSQDAAGPRPGSAWPARIHGPRAAGVAGAAGRCFAASHVDKGSGSAAPGLTQAFAVPTSLRRRRLFSGGRISSVSRSIGP
jgi:hypothetical protein